MPSIEVFADISCPFTHVGLRRLVAEREARGRADVEIRVRAWPLELINGRPMDPEFLRTEIEPLQASVAPDLFQGFDASTFPTTTLPALALTAAAYRRDAASGLAVALDLRTELFERGQDIGAPDVVARIAGAHGLDAPSLDAAHPEIEADWHEGQAKGVIGSPHFFVGADSYFCPVLDIKHDDNGFTISVDHDAMEAFFSCCFA